MPINTELFQNAHNQQEATKQKIYAALREDDQNKILKLLDEPAIKRYLAHLIPGNDDHDHVIRMLDAKLDNKQAGLVCEIFEQAGVNFIGKLSAKTKLCRAVPDAVNINSKILLFHYTKIAHKIRQSVDGDVLPLIYEFAYDDSLPITRAQMKLAATTSEDPWKIAFGKSRANFQRKL